MKYVQAYRLQERGSYWLDPQEYLARLPELLPELPAGARAYAGAPGHYGFGALDCVKDLELSRIDIPGDEDGALRIHFAPNPSKHGKGLAIAYSSVAAFSISSCDRDGLAGLGSFMLDEVLPAPAGCTHETAFRFGRTTIACADLAAEWKPVPS